MDKYCMRMLYAFHYPHGHYGRGKISPLAAAVYAYVVLVLGGGMEPELNEDR